MNPPTPADTERRWRGHLSLWIAVIAILGATLVLGRTLIFGVALTPDSAHHIAAARSVMSGEGFLGYDGHPYNFWPPLYPLALAAASFGIFDPVAVAGPFNAIIAGLTVFTVGRYLQHRLESRFLAVWGCLATALSAPLIGIWSLALSEALFILLATLALIRTDKFLTDGSTRTLIWAAAFSALALQARFIGVAIPVVVGLLLLLAPARPPPGGGSAAAASITRRAGWITTYALITAVPMALWLLRNLLVVGVLTEHHPPRDYPVAMMLGDVAKHLWYWAQAHGTATLVPFAILLIAVTRRRLAIPDWRPVWLFGGFALAYLVLLIAILSLVVGVWMGSGLEGRYLLPLYIPLLIVGLFALDRILAHDRNRLMLGSVGRLPFVRSAMPQTKLGVLAVIVAIVLSLGTVSQINANISAIDEAKSGWTLGFNAPRWIDSETLRYVREELGTAQIYSNWSAPLSVHLGKNRKFVRYPQLRFTIRALERHPIPDGAYVVWFYEIGGGGREYGLATLRQLPGMEPVAELADSIIFRVAR